jgi:hypothetical protein
MDQLCEPLEVNRKFIKMIEEKIKPEYDKVLQEIWELLKEDIDKTYSINVKSTNDESSNVSYS